MSRTKSWTIATLTLVGALALGACSSDDGESAGTTTTSAKATESQDICAIFGELAANRDDRGGGTATPTSAEGWAMRIETTAEIVGAAPAEWRDEAETYLQMVKDRAELAASNGYVDVADLPVDVRDAFIADHRDEQAEVNELIAYMGAECGVETRG